MTLDNADNLLAISIELGRAYPRHLHEFGQCCGTQMRNPGQDGIGKDNKGGLADFLCALEPPRLQLPRESRVRDFHRHFPFIGIDLIRRRNLFWLRLFLVLEILIAGRKRELFHRAVNVAEKRIHGIVLSENRSANRSTQDQSLQCAATAQRHVSLAG